MSSISILVLVISMFAFAQAHTSSSIVENAYGDQELDMYDCHPDVHATRLGIQCDMEGDENALLLAAAIVRCRMPENWAPNWKCSSNSIDDVRTCLQKSTDEAVFTMLAEVYFEVFEYCSKKVSAASIDLLYELSKSVEKSSKQSKKLKNEKTDLIKQIQLHIKHTEILQKDSVDVVDELLDARKAAIKFIDELEGVVNQFADLTNQGTTTDNSQAVAVPGIDGLNAEHPSSENSDDGDSLSDIMQSLSMILPERSVREDKISEKEYLLLYIVGVLSISLAMRKGTMCLRLCDILGFSLVYYTLNMLHTSALKSCMMYTLTLTFLFALRT